MVFDFPGKYELLAMHAVMAVPFTEVVAEFRVDLENVEPVIDWLLAALALIVLRSYCICVCGWVE